MAHLIHPYWNQFPAMDPIWAKVLTAYMIIIGMISWCGNGVVIYIFSTTKSLRTPANLLVINLALSDFGIMITNTPMMGINLYFETWVLGPAMCDLYGGLGSAFGCSSIWSMCMISLDRYQVIVKGVAGRPMTIKLALVKIAFIWAMGSIWTLAPVFGWSRWAARAKWSGKSCLTLTFKGMCLRAIWHLAVLIIWNAIGIHDPTWSSTPSSCTMFRYSWFATLTGSLLL